MSRSTKKVPGYSDSERAGRKAVFLRLMNRRIRRLDPEADDGWIPNGNAYRRFIERWEYRDFTFRYFSERELDASWLGRDRAYKARIK
ncbi:MAG: hypothetical protein ACOC0O_05330 [Spirochaetota bacterium]